MSCYCSGLSDIQAFVCSSCNRNVHPDCLKTPRPSSLLEDVLYNFTCENCSPNHCEKLERMKLSWHTVVHLCLYNLHLSEPGCEFFKWREICASIERNWKCLFGNSRRRTGNISGTVAGVLSQGSGQTFISGSHVCGEAGWWKLKEISPPSVSSVQESSVSSTKRGKRKRTSPDDLLGWPDKRKKEELEIHAPPTSGSVQHETHVTQEDPLKIGVTISPGEELLDIENLEPTDILSDTLPVSQHLDSYHLDESYSSSFFGADDLMSDFYSMMSSFPSSAETVAASETWDSVPSSQFSESAENSLDSWTCDTVKSEPVTTSFQIQIEPENQLGHFIKQETENEMEEQKNQIINFQDCQVIDHKQGPKRKQKKMVTENHSQETTSSKMVVSMSVNEERRLLHILEQQEVIVDGDLEARRLRCKLRLRERQRQHGQPVFDLDNYMRKLSGQQSKTSLEGISEEIRPLPSAVQPTNVKHDFYNEKRVLDRFQLQEGKTQKIKTFQGVSLLNKLVGLEDHQLQMIKSPYTARMLKPFIWRDYESRPLKMKLLQEIKAHSHRRDETWAAPTPPPIDFCYVQPQHIPAVNTLCGEFFWPGIDMSECLQYPDFSCVVLYRKIVIGFAFMVPDVNHNEAYISFLFTHPEWRGAGIGTFMIYHLIQTCMGKDVTLHVAATNPAMLLYQKFGFKAEEFVLNFYEKYFPIDSRESRHAFFMRLRK